MFAGPCSIADEPYSIFNGSTIVAETNTSSVTGVAILASNVPSSITFTSNFSYLPLFTVIRTSLETGT